MSAGRRGGRSAAVATSGRGISGGRRERRREGRNKEIRTSGRAGRRSVIFIFLFSSRH